MAAAEATETNIGINPLHVRMKGSEAAGNLPAALFFARLSTQDHEREGDGGMFASEQWNQMTVDEPNDEPVDEWAEAHCRLGDEGLTELFFSDQIPEIALAKAICAGCPLIGPCLEGAIERREPWGVWGGQLFANGVILAQKRKRGRPPKNRPALGIQMTA
jgi:hypothetical protein